MADRHGATSLAEHVEALLGRRVRRYVGLAVGVTDGSVTSVWAAGQRSQGEAAPDASTTFQIGSVTKVFTALLLADAVERGEVALDQPLDSIITGTATHPEGRPITLEDLASHTSGLPRLPPGLREQAWRHRDDPYARFTASHLEDALAVTPPHPPGGRARYSNYGAGVLGAALNRLAGRSYEELVTERIAAPLGMANTAIDPSGPGIAAAQGHSRRGKPVPDWDMGALEGAGALRSTVDDLLVFLRAHLDPSGSPLRAAIQHARQPRADISRQLSVALGWHVLQRKGASPWWWHNGGTGGFFSFVGFDPAASVGVVVLTNTARSVDRIGGSLLQRLT